MPKLAPLFNEFVKGNPFPQPSQSLIIPNNPQHALWYMFRIGGVCKGKKTLGASNSASMPDGHQFVVKKSTSKTEFLLHMLIP
jgi:hypothetical protein